MKHPLKTTALLVLLFIVAQLVGLWLVNMSIIKVDVSPGGQVMLEHSATAIGERPALAGYQSFLYLLVGVALGTALLLVLIKFRKVRIWKFWFFLAVFLAQSVALGVFLPQLVALAIALGLALLKVYKPEPIIHNLTEVFMYAGIAVLLVPIFDVPWALILLLAISVYDAWAVWKSKHMVTMAEFQKEGGVFAGLMVPKASHAKSSTSSDLPPPPRKGREIAILGGGDIAFPLIFAGVVMEGLVRSGLGKLVAFGYVLLITAGATLALVGLFAYSKKERYYPAMPFITAGCLLGWGVLTLLL